jgi:hypothetical protein
VLHNAAVNFAVFNRFRALTAVRKKNEGLLPAQRDNADVTALERLGRAGLVGTR